MAKYYVLLVLAFFGVLFFVFLEDPCVGQLRTDFAERYPSYEILDSGAGTTSTTSAQCHIRYLKPDREQIYEETWLYRDAGSGWVFSRIIETVGNGGP